MSVETKLRPHDGCQAWAALEAGGSMQRLELDLGPLGEQEVEVEVTHCGVCHSDVHLVDDNWGHGKFPLVPGHEIVGRVVRCGVGSVVLEPGTRVGIGWQAGACMVCARCKAGEENLCRRQQLTCVGRTGGFAQRVRVDGHFVYPLPEAIRSEHAAPLLCAGATVFAPFERAGVGVGSKVGVIGLGGLGHLAVKFARALGAEVTVFSSSAGKHELATQLGATRFVDSRDSQVLRAERDRHDLILSTVHCELDWARFVRALRPGGGLCFVGAPSEPLALPIGLLVTGQRSVAGSIVASRASTMRMLEFAAAEGVEPMVECMPFAKAEAGLNRVREGRARFRIVLEREL